MLSKKQK